MKSGARANKATALLWCSSVDPAGGMERVALNIANGLAASGWKVVLVGPFSRVDSLRRAIRPDVEFVDYQAGRSLPGLWRTMRFLNRIAKQHGVDVISAHGSVFPLLFSSVPVVWTEHDLRYSGGQMLGGFRGIAWRRIRNRVLRGSWKLITVSHYVRDQVCLRLKLPNHAGRVIYNGLPNAAVLEALPPPRFTRPFQIGFLGRLVPHKHPLDVFDLSVLLNRMGVPHVWHVFGDGVMLPEMQQAASSREGHSVTLRGLVATPEEAFSQIDLLGFLSRGEQEGLGMVLLEALAANRRIVAWDAGCIREVLGGRATLIPPFSLERYAEAVAAALQQGRRPREDRDDRWGEDRMIAEYDAVLTDTVFPPSPAPGGSAA